MTETKHTPPGPSAPTLTEEQASGLKECFQRKPGKEGSIRALFRLARLESDLVELATFDAAKYGRGDFSGPGVAYGTLEDVLADKGLLNRGEALQSGGLYITPAVLSDGARFRYPHRVWQRAEGTATEVDVLSSRVVVIDVDVAPLVNGKPAKRKRNTSKHEWQTAIRQGWMIRCWLADLGVHVGALGFASSGNGCHVVLALDGAWSAQWKALRERFLAATAKLWDLDDGETTYRIDPAMADGGRFIPLYGTKKAKAAHHQDYPQRHSWLDAPEVVRPMDEAAFLELVGKIEAVVTSEVQARWDEREKREGKPAAAKTTPKKAAPEGTSGSGAWADYYRALDALPIAQVAESFGISLEQCSHCGEKKGFDVLPEANVAKCQHQTEGCGTHKNGVYNAVDLVRMRQGGGLDWRDSERRKAAQDAIADRFGISRPRGRRPKEPEQVTDDEARKRAYGFEPEAEFCSEPESLEALDGAEPVAAETRELRACTDLGNAYRVIDQRGDDLVRSGEGWMQWSGDRWSVLSEDGIRRVVIGVVERIPLEAVGMEGDKRSSILGWARESQARKNVVSAEVLARSLSTQVAKERFDADGWLLGCRNGVVDLRTGKLREHRRDDYITRHVACDFDPEAKAPNFTRVLEWAQPESDVRAYLMRLWGYYCTGVVRDHVFPIHWGQGGNAKGTILHAIRKALGDYAVSLPMDALLARKQDSHPVTLADLPGARFVLASESNEGSMWDEALLKRLTGGDGGKFRGMYQSYVEREQTWHLGVTVQHWTPSETPRNA